MSKYQGKVCEISVKTPLIDGFLEKAWLFVNNHERLRTWLR
jgi:hypothetical protein